MSAVNQLVSLAPRPRATWRHPHAPGTMMDTLLPVASPPIPTSRNKDGSLVFIRVIVRNLAEGRCIIVPGGSGGGGARRVGVRGKFVGVICVEKNVRAPQAAGAARRQGY